MKQESTTDGSTKPTSDDSNASAETISLKPKGDAAASGKRKFHNGWTRQLENLVAEWADKASCYQWMHQKTEVKFARSNMYFTIPVIVMSTLTGTANFATESIVGGTDMQKYVTFGIGAISLIAGIISTVANFLRYAQGSEAHRVAGISWGKFQRFISIELSLHPNERMDAMSFLKMGRIELDRLIEQSPPIPPKTVEEFIEAFKAKTDIIKPEIAGGIEHTRVFDDKESRLARVAAEAAYVIQQKKGLMRQLVMEDIDKRIVERAKEERREMEDALRHEILTHARETARETTVAALQNPAIGYSALPVAKAARHFATGKAEAAAVVPQGAVEKAKERIRRRASITMDGGHVVSTSGHNTVFQEAAKMALARQERASPVRIEIVDGDDEERHDVRNTGEKM